MNKNKPDPSFVKPEEKEDGIEIEVLKEYGVFGKIEKITLPEELDVYAPEINMKN